MIAPHFSHAGQALQELAIASAKLYPEFIAELEDESGERVDFRREGAILIAPEEDVAGCPELTEPQLRQLEPQLEGGCGPAFLMKDEATVDPRRLTAALVKAAKHRGVDVVSGSEVSEVTSVLQRVSGVKTARTHYAAPVVINCAGAWAGGIPPHHFPIKPVRGQMLAVVPVDHHAGREPLLRHVVRAPAVYIVPRSDGRLLIGSTLEDAGFDKHTDAATIQSLHQEAANLAPAIGQCRMLEAWAGLRPGSEDEMPLLGATATAGYFVAAGHYTNGILLAPATARFMGELVRGLKPQIDLSAFSPLRFHETALRKQG
jgi:glycine oxidase